MIRSMTGYGQGRAEGGGLRLQAEIRGWNHRFADLRLRLPAGLLDFEGELRRRVLDRVSRGRVEASISVEPAGEGPPGPALNRPLVLAALAAARTMREELGVPGDVDAATLLGLPGALRVETAEPSWTEDERALVLRALDAALTSFDAERRREGEALRITLVERAARLGALVGALQERSGAIPAALRDRLLDRLRALEGSIEFDPLRIAQEAALLADRSDITEELDRLRGHVAQVERLLGSPDGEPVGKRLDFLLQEIHRETNTVSSKSGDLELTRHALALKLECEKLREQAQNLE